MSIHSQGILRRNFCLCCVGMGALAASGVSLSPSQVFAKAQGIVDKMRGAAATAEITTHKIRGGFAVLEGSGGNILALPGADGTLLVDAGITASEPRIKQSLADFKAAPVRQLINTHWHFDHADGNEWMGRDGAHIIAQQNTLRHLHEAQRVEDWDFDFPPAPPKALPTEVFGASHDMAMNGETLKLVHYEGGAHTDSDIYVLFEKNNVLHVGDTYWNGIYPFIDYSTGGSIDGTIRALEKNLALADRDTIIIPGHGMPVSNRAEMLEFHDMLVAIRDNVARLKAKGMTLAQTQAEKPTKAFDAKWGQFVIGPDFFTKLVYEGV
ncbi:MBL fold metallo-hydrolase [Aliirhizobium terrae]|uniref:MBL fold metallo-hydrolase n=1 Tax=Terrirhizobium terrae TaxID=2926709 RepID=UPI002577591F|nr:MBL fold metallo-hydrolase [Rhizobium sp. CC-CFT758]WJH41889.1 MBL fold metallo-hydrolase [Rhizobium sp. CC-CFT758]